MRMGVSEKKSGLEKARGAGRREIVVVVVMVAAATRMMMKSVSKARVMQLYIRSLEIFSKGTVTVFRKTIRAIFPDSMTRSSSARNWRPICLTPGRS